MIEKKSLLMGMVITMTLPISIYQRSGDILLYMGVWHLGYGSS